MQCWLGAPAGSQTCHEDRDLWVHCVTQPRERRDCAAQGLEPPAWHGAPCTVGRQAVAPGEQEGIRGWAEPQGEALWGAGTAAELCTGTVQPCQHGVTALLLRQGSMRHPVSPGLVQREKPVVQCFLPCTAFCDALLVTTW